MRRLKAWLHRRRQPARYALLDGLLATQALSRRELMHKQARDLAAMVEFARDHTAYYAETLGRLPADWTADDLPILTKPDVVARLPDLLAQGMGHDPDTTPIGHTGGSTGRPLAFYYDEAKHELMRAGMMRSYMMAGWRPGEKILNLWGARQDTVAGGVFGSVLGGERIGDWIAAERTIPAHEMSERRLHDWARFVQDYRPTLLQGYASILAALARFVVARGLRMPGSLIGVFSTAEVLDDAQRAVMEQAFGCKVFNQYGSREIPNIACECRHGQMHVFSDMVWLEAQDGRLLVTSLTNRLMPMIRYENGDAGELLDGDCACGSPFPLMRMGLCRRNDLIRTAGGKTIHPSYFNRLLYGQTQIEQYQFVQDEIDRLTLNVVAAAPLAPERVAALQGQIRSEVDERMRLEVAYPAAIERTASGKHRFVVCRLPAGDMGRAQA